MASPLKGLTRAQIQAQAARRRAFEAQQKRMKRRGKAGVRGTTAKRKRVR